MDEEEIKQLRGILKVFEDYVRALIVEAQAPNVFTIAQLNETREATIAKIVGIAKS